MPAILSAAATINGVANSYIVTGTYNLDELATAAASVGFTKAGETYVFNPAGTARILALGGVLLENRKGIRAVNVRNNGHLCYAYGAGSDTTLGLLDAASGVYTGAVHSNYETTALTLGGDLMNGTEGKCFIGAGTFRGVAGSVSYLHPSRSDLDIFNNVTLATFDDFSLYLTTAGAAYSHFWKASGKTLTTNRTIFIFQQRPIEGPNTVTSVTPFYADTGFRLLAPLAGSVLRIERPTYSGVDIAGGTATSEIHIVDPQSRWMGPVESSYAPHTGIKKIFRTLRVNFVDAVGQIISNATPKLVTVTPAGVASVSTFVDADGVSEVLQSTRESGVTHNAVGTGWTNQAAYDFYAVGFGYSAQNLGVDVGMMYEGTTGVPWNPTSARSPFAAIAYAAVPTTPFAFSTTGAGTLTISGNCTTDQIGQYLTKHAYDNAESLFWRDRGHVAATADGAVCVVGAISIVVGDGATVSAGTITQELRTAGTISGPGALEVVYSSSLGTSTILEIRNVKPGASYIAANNLTKATLLFGTNSESTAQDYTVRFPPGSAGTQIYVARKSIGDFFDYEVVTLEPGLIWYSFVDIADEGAKETNPATLAAYTSLQTNTKLYDYVGLFQTTEAGIKLGKFLTREGAFLKWAAPYSAVVNQGASSLLSKSGNVFTIKASGMSADANYSTQVLTPPATLTAASTEVMGTDIVDAVGDSALTIQGGSGDYEIWKVPVGTPEDNYSTGTLLAATVGLGKWRFTGLTGFYLLVRDKAKNNRDTCSMAKGTYTIGLYAGKEQITVAQLPEVYELQDSLALMQIDVDNMTTALTEANLAIDQLGLPLQAGVVVDANIVKINSKTLQGQGVAGNSFRPV